MVEFIRWNTHFLGVYIDEDIVYDGIKFINLINSLKSYNMIYLGYNTQGIIVENSSATLKEEFYKFKENTENFNYYIHTKFAKLSQQISSIINDIKKSNEKSNNDEKNIGDEFYILFDLLPKEFKQKIKIYIQNDKNNL